MLLLLIIQHQTRAISLAFQRAQFSNSIDNCIEVDKSKNIFFSFNERRYCANLAADALKNDALGTFLTVPEVIYDKVRDRIYHTQANIGNNEYWWYDVNNDFVQMGKGEISWDDRDFIPEGDMIMGLLAAPRR